MTGWNSEPDYTPPNSPWWVWAGVAAFVFGPFNLWLAFG